MRWVMITLALLIGTLSGCIMSRDGKVKPPVPWPPQVSQPAKKTISLSVTEEGLAPGSQQDGMKTGQDSYRNQAAKSRREQAAKAYMESELFSSVLAIGEPADLQAEITIHGEDDAGFPWSGAISILTFTMIPGRVAQDLVMTTVYKDRDQRIIGGVDTREGFGSWIQFFLLFANPFVDGPDVIMDEARYDMHRATIVEAHSRGVF